MCGIAGFEGRFAGDPKAIDWLDSMLKAIQHRGPDYSGKELHDQKVALGHNRLSILDLSEAGNQPFRYKDYTICFNGEVYNYLELQKELEKEGHVFKTTCDTEVLLAAYDQWGEACVDRFIGMWAFVIYHHEDGRLFISRDRFGIKPLYYMIHNGTFYFASEIKALRALPIFDSTVDLNQQALFLQLGWHTFGENTMYEKVKMVERATNMVVKDGAIESTNHYWDVDLDDVRIDSMEEAKEAFRECFLNSIMLHNRSDVPVGISLSGGIDSSSIASATAHLNPKQDIRTFSVFYAEHTGMDERPYMQAVLDKYPSITPTFISPTTDDIFNVVDEYVDHQDLPLLGSSFISHFFVVKAAKDHGMKVLLEGQGADEYLVGYLRSFYRILAQNPFSLRRQRAFAKHLRNEEYGAITAAKRIAMGLLYSLGGDQRFQGLEMRLGQPFMPSSKEVDFAVKKHPDKLNEFLYNLLFFTELPRLLHYTDMNSMFHSIESRVPFLDHRLVELLFQVSPELKVQHGITKAVMREGLKDILPEKIYSRKDKIGFKTPGEKTWLRSLLNKGALTTHNDAFEGIKLDKATRLLDKYKAGDNKHATMAWRLVFLNQWVTKYG